MSASPKVPRSERLDLQARSLCRAHECRKRRRYVGHVEDLDRGAGFQARDGEGHGDPVVAMTLDGTAPETLRAADPQAVLQQLVLDPESGKAVGHRGETVALLDPQLERPPHLGLAFRARGGD